MEICPHFGCGYPQVWTDSHFFLKFFSVFFSPCSQLSLQGHPCILTLVQYFTWQFFFVQTPPVQQLPAVWLCLQTHILVCPRPHRDMDTIEFDVVERHINQLKALMEEDLAFLRQCSGVGHSEQLRAGAACCARPVPGCPPSPQAVQESPNPCGWWQGGPGSSDSHQGGSPGVTNPPVTSPPISGCAVFF